MTTTPASEWITRQILPKDAKTSNVKSTKYRQLYRWVSWCTEAITLDEAVAHLSPCGGVGACIVQVRRGPQGGWTGAFFITHAADLPSPAALRKKITINGNLPEPVTLYYGWKHEHPAGARVKAPEPPPVEHGQYRAHLVLHA